MVSRVWPVSLIFRLMMYVTLVAVSVLAFWPAADAPVSTGWDKANHFLAFFVLFWLLDFGWPTSLSIIQKTLILVAYGLAIEVVQSILPARLFSLADMAVDVLAIGAYLLVHARVRRLEFLIQKLPFVEQRPLTQWSNSL